MRGRCVDRDGSIDRSEDVVVGCVVSVGAGLPVAVGSGVDVLDAAALSKKADALIVGSSIKQDGDWRRPVDPERLKRLVDALEG